MDKVEDIIKAQIRQNGPMDIGAFMTLALTHPKLGYYMTRDPIGAAGDFTTSPEISQIFAEMITVCMIEAWIRAGKPDVHLVELGPGRGTLMADFLRCCKNAPDFFERMTLHLVETSPVLRDKQRAALPGFKPVFHDSIDTLPADAPLLIIANEFFDALPIRQSVMTAEGWRERVVGLEGDTLVFGLAPPAPLTLKPTKTPAPVLPKAPEGSLMEYSPVRDAVMAQLAARLQKQGGFLLAIDYGHAVPGAIGDTFQAVKKHQYVSPLTDVGNADLTSHVDFARLAGIAAAAGCNVLGPVTQKSYLETMGMATRLAALQATNPDNKDLGPAAMRLVDQDGMGGLFKALGVTGNVTFCQLKPAGFHSSS